jgi:hypothetical protein
MLQAIIFRALPWTVQYMIDMPGSVFGPPPPPPRSYLIVSSKQMFENQVRERRFFIEVEYLKEF